jgi:hypothetical protein
VPSSKFCSRCGKPISLAAVEEEEQEEEEKKI